MTKCCCGVRWNAPQFLSLGVVLFLLSSLFSEAHAQRGRGYGTYKPAPVTANNGFSGMFDTEQATASSVVLDLPTSLFEYGINDRLSLGVYTGPLLLNLLGMGTLIAKTRYQVYGNGRTSVALTGYLGAWVPGVTGFGYLGMGTLNANFFLDSNQAIGLSFLASRVGLTLGTLGTIDYLSAAGTLAFLSAQYRFYAGKDFTLEALLGSFVVQSVDVDSAGFGASAQFGIASLSDGGGMARVTADFRAGESFLLSPQFWLISVAGEETLLLPLPFFNVSYRTP